MMYTELYLASEFISGTVIVDEPEKNSTKNKCDVKCRALKPFKVFCFDPIKMLHCPILSEHGGVLQYTVQIVDGSLDAGDGL